MNAASHVTMNTVLELLHRPSSDDAAIGFYGADRRTGFAVASMDLGQYDLVGATTHCTVNQFKRLLAMVDLESEEQEIVIQRQGKLAKWLCAAYADVTTEPSARRLAELEAREIVPQPSIIVSHGSGATLLWLLCDNEDRSLPVGAHEDGPRGTMVLYRAIQKQLNSRLAQEFGAQPHQATVTGLIRIPSESVEWRVVGDEPRYRTISELCQFLRIKEPKRREYSKRSKKAKHRKKSAARRESWIQLSRGRINKLLKLIDIRDKLNDEVGREAIRLYAMWAKKAGASADDVSAACERLNREALDNPLQDMASQWRSNQAVRVASTRYSKVSDQTIADLLDITLEESIRVGWPCAAQFRTAESFMPPLSEPERRLRILRELQQKPSINEAVKILASKGILVSESTAARDLRAAFDSVSSLRSDVILTPLPQHQETTTT